MNGSFLIVLSAISLASCVPSGFFGSGTWGSGTIGSNCQTHWIGDGYCDDENNNAECFFDAGDCCSYIMTGWDNYCQECACKETFGSTTNGTWGSGTWGSGTNGTWGSGTWGSGTWGTAA